MNRETLSPKESCNLLDTSDWQGFAIGDLFDEFKRGKANQTKLEDGHDLFYVGAKRDNNGVMLHCAYDETLISAGRCIVFISNGQGSVGYANYMDVDFVASTDLILGYADWLNLEIGLFLATLFSLERPKYSFGRKWGRFLKGTIVRLPIQRHSDGAPVIDPMKRFSKQGYIPDWDYMEQFIHDLNSKPISTVNSTDTVGPLGVTSWKEFAVGDIFEIRNGRGITNEEIEENPGTLSAVQSGEENNGVMGYISEAYCRKSSYVYTTKKCLTVARTGTAGFVSYQADGCVVGDSAKILSLKHGHATTGVYLFLQTVLSQNRFKYSYGRKVTEDKYLKDVLDLPVRKDNQGNPVIDPAKTYHPEGFIPDWQFMENFVRSLPYADRIPEPTE